MRTQSSLIFYVGNGVVKAGIVANEKNASGAGKTPRMLSSRVRELPHFNERDREHLESKILSEFATLVKEVKTVDIPKLAGAGVNGSAGRNLNISVKNVVVLISSPWYISETSIIKMKENKPFVVTDALLASEKENLVKAYRDAHHEDVTVLEQKIINVMLNGYPTNEPLKKKAQTLDMTVFTSFARKSSIDQIRDTIDQNFHASDIAIHSQSLVSFSVISDAWHDMSQYVIADITSELTELVAVRKGVLSEACSFPLGKRFLITEISDSLKVSSEVAESLLRMKSDNKIEEGLREKVDQALLDAKKKWQASFSKSLNVMSASSSLPSTFFLFAPKDAVSIFSDFIQTEEYQQFSFAEGKFEVKNLGVQDLMPYCKIEVGAGGDLSLMIGAIFNNKLSR